MIEVEDPPTIGACGSCMRPLIWMLSARKLRSESSPWVAWIQVDDHTVQLHRCHPLQEPITWRAMQRGDPPSEEYLEAKQALRGKTQERTEEEA